ncbi:MAG: hypothetical protein ACXWEF_03775, partial [Solirubrobacterales bacterium]
LVGVTALGRSALEAETLSKAALLSGPERGREILSERGGMLVLENGTVELAGAVDAKLIGSRSGAIALPSEPCTTAANGNV